MSIDKIERREFLKLMGCSSLLLILPTIEGCQEREQPKTTSQVSLVKDSDERYALNRAIELVGGLDFLSPGDSVLLKLALNSSNPFPATTSPLVVSELIKSLKDRGAEDIFVGDKSPTWQDTMNCLKETGIYQAAVNAGAEIAVFEDDDMVPVKPADANYWPKGFSIPNLFNQVDHIITLPTLRTHRSACFTMGIKTFVGAIPQADRFCMHVSCNFLKAIAEIPLCTDKIRFSLLDARQGFNSGGPDSGNLITPGIIIASKDLVAADAVGLALLKAIGTTLGLNTVNIWKHPTIKRGVQAYSPSLSFETLELLSEGVDNIEEIRDQLRL
jgi:uncharacterized protein (DUF362 family)